MSVATFSHGRIASILWLFFITCNTLVHYELWLLLIHRFWFVGHARGHSMTRWTQFCPFLTTTYLYVDIFNPKRGQKSRFFDHLPPLIVHVVIECPPIFASISHIWYGLSGLHLDDHGSRLCDAVWSCLMRCWFFCWWVASPGTLLANSGISYLSEAHENLKVFSLYSCMNNSRAFNFVFTSFLTLATHLQRSSNFYVIWFGLP